MLLGFHLWCVVGVKVHFFPYKQPSYWIDLPFLADHVPVGPFLDSVPFH